MGRGDGGGDGDDDEKKFGLTLSASKMISLEDKDDGHHQAAENLITYTWPEVFVPKNVRVSHHVAEKLRFYGDQQFVVSRGSMLFVPVFSMTFVVVVVVVCFFVD